MATLNGNDVYLELDSVDVSAYWTGEVSRSASNNVVEVTAGAGQGTIQRASGLHDYALAIDVVYDVADLGTYKSKLVKGSTYTLVYGPEGNDAGKPKDEVPVILASVDGPNPTINKDMVMFSLSFQGADTAVSLLESGTF
jgi:hypothetical protein